MKLLLLLMPLLLLLVIAAITDLRRRRIPNWLTLTVAVTGFLQAVAWEHSVVSWWQALLGWLVGLLINVPLFVLHIRGGGDMKLFAGVGAWLGPINILAVFIVATIIAMVVAIVQAVATGRVKTVAHNVAHLSLDMLHGEDFAGEEPSAGESQRQIPYAVPILLAVVAIVSF